MVIAVILLIAGIILAMVSLMLMLEHASVLWVIPMAVGALLSVAGFVLLIMELLETWLSRGQKALVDGLQAG